MTPPVRVRRQRAADATRIAELQQAATAELREVYRPRGIRPAADKAPNTAVRLVAVAGEQVVGMAEYLGRPGRLYVQSLAVDPAWRRRGVARVLLEAAEQEAQTAGLPLLALATIAETGNAVIFRRLGFAVEAAGPDPAFEARGGGTVYRLEMVRPVPPTD